MKPTAYIILIVLSIEVINAQEVPKLREVS